MNFKILHEIKGRMRIHVLQKRMTFEQADMIEYYLAHKKCITGVKVNHRTANVIINFAGDRETIIKLLKCFSYEKSDIPQTILENSGRQMNDEFKEKLIFKVIYRYSGKLLIPYPVRAVYTALKSTKYIAKGVQSLASRKLDVSVLDATAVGVSILRRDINTAGSTMFLLGIGELLEEWTHKKSVDDLARSMALNTGNVWVVRDGSEMLISSNDVVAGDRVIVHMGSTIPFDGTVVAGEAMVNQASLTGESVPVRKTLESTVYAGTIVEEGEVTLLVKEVSGASRFEKIVQMIEETEKLKSSAEGKAEHLADRLVPYTLGGTALVYLLTRNVTKALSVLMVDFSCALKLAMPISVLSAIREAREHNINVKGGKFLEAMADADTIVFDKTGTLTKACPTVVDVISFCDKSEDELLRIAACMEEHFPHSMAKAVVDAAAEKNLQHDEMHTKVQYTVAHGISTEIEGKKAIIGSAHFVFEDEHCEIPEGREEEYKALREEYSHLYLAIENKLAAVICISDPVREEAEAVVNSLRSAGMKHIVMMTGDGEKAASAIAAQVGVDEYYSEVLPEDKAAFVDKMKAKGHKVVMIGDGINDSPALSAANVGIAISDGAEIARDIADITISADNLFEIVTLKLISNALMHRIHRNYRTIVGFNSMLLIGGVAGILQPTMSALLHNTSTLLIGVNSMKNLLQ